MNLIATLLDFVTFRGGITDDKLLLCDADEDIDQIKALYAAHLYPNFEATKWAESQPEEYTNPSIGSPYIFRERYSYKARNMKYFPTTDQKLLILVSDEIGDTQELRAAGNFVSAWFGLTVLIEPTNIFQDDTFLERLPNTN